MLQFTEINNTNLELDLQARAGNCKSIEFPCTTIPKSINALNGAEPNSGHDLNLNGFFFLIDMEISKRLRCVLLSLYGRYINVVSSQSLMHRPELSKKNVDSTSADFKYGISIAINLRLVKKMYAELIGLNHIEEIASFVEFLGTILDYKKIPKPEPIHLGINILNKQNSSFQDVDCEIDYLMCGAYTVCIQSNLIISEQFLRYTSNMLVTNHHGFIQDVYTVKTIGQNFVDLWVIASEDQLRIIYEQRKNHKRKEWQTITSAIKNKLKIP